MSDIVDIVIPVYQEAENIWCTLGQIEKKVSTAHRIYLVYDFAEDNTLPVVREFVRQRGAKNIFLIKNRYGDGVLNAIKTGFDSASEDAVVVVMADGSDDLSIVDAMFDRIKQGYDIVCGSRYVRGGGQIGGPRLKKFLSRAAGISLHILTGIPTHDISNSFKMYRKSLLRDVVLESNGGFEIGMEITVKAFLKGARISEIPCVWRERAAGKSRFKFSKWLPGYVRWYLYAIMGQLKNKLRGR